MKWGLLIGNRAKRQMRRLTAAEREQIDDAFEDMRNDPFHGDVKFLKGMDGAFRYRTGSWRILYDLSVDTKVIKVTKVERRGSNTY